MVSALRPREDDMGEVYELMNSSLVIFSKELL
jgi:hypothetical protein